MRDRRVRIIKEGSQYGVGETVELGAAECKRLLRAGIAMMSKDMTVADQTTKKKAVRLKVR